MSVADSGCGRVFGLDLLRTLAIILVVFDHTFPRVGSEADPSQTVFDLIGRGLPGPDAVLFLMVSGALLLPVNGSWRRFFARRLVRIAVPFVVWSLFYAWIGYHYKYGNMWWMIHQMEWFWLTPSFGPGWFVLMLAGIYLFMPVISPWLRSASRRQMEFFVLVWLASGMLPLLTYVMGVRHYEITVFGQFYGYMGYAVAGFYLMRYPMSCRTVAGKTAVITSLLLLGIAIPLMIYFSGWKIDPMTIIPDNLSFGVMAYGCLLFALLSPVKGLGRAGNAIVNVVSRNAFGIYLCHSAFITIVVRGNLQGVVGTWWAMPVVFFGSLAAAELLRRIPYIGRYII